MLHRQRPTPCLRALPPMMAQIATALGPTLDEPGALQQSSTVHVSEGSKAEELNVSKTSPLCGAKADIATRSADFRLRANFGSVAFPYCVFHAGGSCELGCSPCHWARRREHVCGSI